MLLDGWHLLGEAAAARLAVEKIAICGPPTAREQDVARSAAAFGRTDRGGVGHGDERALARELAHRRGRERATAVGRRATPFCDPAPALVLAATGLQDPGNAGAIIRSAAAAGATGVVARRVLRRSVGLESAARVDGQRVPVPVLRSRGIGSLVERMARSRACALSPRCRAAARRCTTWTSRSRRRCCSAAKAPACPTRSSSLPTCASPFRCAAVESLNVAVAAAVLLYEAQRQRTLVSISPRLGDRLTPSEPVRRTARTGRPADGAACRAHAAAHARRGRGPGRADRPGPAAARGDRARPAAVDHPLGTARHRQDHARAPDRRPHARRSSSPSARCWRASRKSRT